MIDLFSILAPVYERVFKVKDPHRIIHKIDPPIDGRLLDAGGGTGRVAQVIRNAVKQLVVADESMGMLFEARKKEKLQPLCTHTENLPFPDECFDRVLMIDAMHHVELHESTALELWRVLKPGGRLVIEEPDIRHAAVKVVSLLEKIALMRSHFLSPEEIQDLFQAPNAIAHLEKDGYIAWIIIEKIALQSRD